MLHGVEPLIDVVRVAEEKADRVVARLVEIVDALEGHLLRTEPVGELCQVDAIAQILLALSGRRQLLAYTRLDPSD